MGRRANNEGTICQRKDGRWCAAITMPNGKRKWFYGKEQRDVLSKLTEARSLLQRNMLPEPSRITFGQWLDSWLVNHSNVSRHQRQSLVHLLVLFVLCIFGSQRTRARENVGKK